MRWGVRSMVWDVFILIIALVVALYGYIQFINDPNIQKIFFS